MCAEPIWNHGGEWILSEKVGKKGAIIQYKLKIINRTLWAEK
jgi:hypothetical protein